eukprot:TRINITY_DN19885_c0_g1_i1.p1 TRINITY_DN19885_c0_g1~~TRINITY_DN19885_c0_g1_i1.p1  ORF type:complete len:236 (+),score=36.11 TRINITY_DN19885_c0_g1_i1:29-709(+)
MEEQRATDWMGELIAQVEIAGNCVTVRTEKGGVEEETRKLRKALWPFVDDMRSDIRKLWKGTISFCSVNLLEAPSSADFVCDALKERKANEDSKPEEKGREHWSQNDIRDAGYITQFLVDYFVLTKLRELGAEQLIGDIHIDVVQYDITKKTSEGYYATGDWQANTNKQKHTTLKLTALIEDVYKELEATLCKFATSFPNQLEQMLDLSVFPDAIQNTARQVGGPS